MPEIGDTVRVTGEIVSEPTALWGENVLGVITEIGDDYVKLDPSGWPWECTFHRERIWIVDARVEKV